MSTNPPEPTVSQGEGVWNGYRLRVTYGHIGTRPAVVGLELWGVEPMRRSWPHQVDPEVAAMQGWDALPDQPVTADVLRELRLGELLGGYIAHQHALARAAQQLGADPVAAAAYAELFPSPKRGRGRPPLSDEFLTVVADACATRKKSETERYAVERALHQRVGESTVRRWVRLARDRGKLPPAPARRQQEPTPKQPRTRRKTP